MRFTLPPREKLLFCLFCFSALFSAGMLFNFLAVANNKGLMPVNFDWDYETETHISYKSLEWEVNYIYLTDYFRVDFFDIGIVFSIGDVLLIFSFILILIFAFKYSKRLWIDIRISKAINKV